MVFNTKSASILNRLIAKKLICYYICPGFAVSSLVKIYSVEVMLFSALTRINPISVKNTKSD